MNVTYRCPGCGVNNRAPFDADTQSLVCSACGSQTKVPAESLAEDRLRRCLVCPSSELFLRKDFPQRLGVGIVVLGFVASSVAWYYYLTYLTFAILFATALFDVLLFALVGNALVCYRCGAEYRALALAEEHGAFSLETHERYRQQAARLSQAGSARSNTSPPPLQESPTTSDHE